jgi:hypothetical protein
LKLLGIVVDAVVVDTGACKSTLGEECWKFGVVLKVRHGCSFDLIVLVLSKSTEEQNEKYYMY